jgi:hypothetical protein
MRPLERLLYASDSELNRLFGHLLGHTAAMSEAFLDEIARDLGLERTQLICGLGFNPNLLRAPAIVKALGFESFNVLWRARNAVFVDDTYRSLSIDDILSIYAVLGRGDGDTAFSDLIRARLTKVEENIEATINPITLGSYKLEVRSIYERNLISRDFIDWRLGGNYAVLRRLSNEVSMMLATGLIKPAEILASPGVTIEEKTRLLHDGLVSAEAVNTHLRNPSLPEAERRALEQAVRQSGTA